jgi:hypothetical protein
MECIILEHEKGFLITQFMDNGRQSFVAVAFGKDGRLGVSKYKIAEIIPAIRQFFE